MVSQPKRIGGLVLRLIVGLALLGGPRVGSAQGNWEVIAPHGSALGQVTFCYYGGVLAVDAASNLYVADSGNNRVLKYTPGP